MAIYAGLMSGTSLDGIDVALVRREGEEERPEHAELVAFRSVPYDEPFRTRLRVACEAGTSAELCALGFELGRRFAAALLRSLEETASPPGALAAVGSHGQTVWHEPPREDRPGSTLQIGEAAVVAEETGVPVVADFRVRDVAAGGHGAPLVPYFDRVLLSSPSESRAIQNVGGMANVTGLPAVESEGRPIAFDTGPGNALLDGAARRLTGGRLDRDEDGRLAAAGEVSEPALREWLEDPFFRTPPPRSTGRERFGEPALEAWLDRHPELSAEEALATLTELTARSIADSYRWLGEPPDAVYLCGGGARNPELRRRLSARLDPVPVRTLDALGWDGDAREAAAFALLARQHLLGHAVDLTWATGARGPRRLGKRVPA